MKLNSNSNSAEYALFQVSLKSLIINNDKLLTLYSPDGKYDFPGGRINSDEVNHDLEISLTREMEEELSEDFKFKINNFAFSSKRFYFKGGQRFDVLVIFFDATAINRKIKLSDEHSSFDWLNFSDVFKNPDKFVSKEEHDQLKQYLSFSKKQYNNVRS